MIDKPGKGAFCATDLDLILHNRGIKSLIVCGVTTEVCVNTTVREANDRGYECVVLADCVGSYFPEFQRVALEMIKAQGGIFGWVSDSKRALAALRRMSAVATSPTLDALSLGFRDRFLTYDELTRQVRAWADAFPELCRATSIGRTPEGRELWLLTLGPDPDRARPSAWVDGNMHASELCGSSVALAIAEDVLRLHLRRRATGGEPGVRPPWRRRACATSASTCCRGCRPTARRRCSPTAATCARCRATSGPRARTRTGAATTSTATGSR